MEWFLIIVGISCFAVLLFVIVARIEKKRTDAIQAKAAELGLSFEKEDRRNLSDRFSHFKLFGRGHGRRVKNIIEASADDMRIEIFDYRFTTGGGKNSQTHKQTVIAVDAKSLDVPQFLARPERLFDGIGSFLGFQDIDFDDDRQFSKSFVLQGESEEAVRELFTSEVRQFFISQMPCAIEGNGRTVIYYKPGKRLSPDRLKDLMGIAFRLSQLFSSEQLDP